MGSVVDELNKNIVSVLLGALFFMFLATWVDTTKGCCKCVFSEEIEGRYDLCKKKLWSCLTVSLFIIFMAILIYGIYREKVNFKW